MTDTVVNAPAVTDPIAVDADRPDMAIATLPEVATECVPKADDSAKVKDMFKLFMGIVDQLKEYEELDKLNTTENRCSEDCT